MAFLAGIPSELATQCDTTASTPPIPTVPNATTGSGSVRAAGDRDRRLSDRRPRCPSCRKSPSRRPPRPARAGRSRRLAGAAGPRKVAGSTPSTEVEHPVDPDPARLDRHGGGQPGLPGQRVPNPGGRRERRDHQRVGLHQAAQLGDGGGFGRREVGAAPSRHGDGPGWAAGSVRAATEDAVHRGRCSRLIKADARDPAAARPPRPACRSTVASTAPAAVPAITDATRTANHPPRPRDASRAADRGRRERRLTGTANGMHRSRLIHPRTRYREFTNCRLALRRARHALDRQQPTELAG